jgi:pyrimidine-nucleoside phosphorylase
MLWLGGKATSIGDGMKLCKSAIYSGKAYEKFCQIVARQGGDISFVEQPGKYVKAGQIRDVKSPMDGYVVGFDTMKIGLLGIELGAGRKKVDDVIDPAAGIVLMKKLGDRVVLGEVLASIHTNIRGVVERAALDLVSCIRIAASPTVPPKIVRSYLDAGGVKSWDAAPPY